VIVNGRIAGIALVLSLCTPVFAAAQQCLHGADEGVEQNARKRAALSATRQVNTLEANRPGARGGNYFDQAEMAAWYATAPAEVRGTTSLNFDRAGEVLPGWQLTLEKTPNGYWFMIKDKTDPCGFAYISNQQGVIYTAEPIR
jgi:hypothetical protein